VPSTQTTGLPRYVRLAGYGLFVFGVLPFLLDLTAQVPGELGVTVVDVVVSLVMIVAGFGLILGTRWGWILALVLGLVGLFAGVWIIGGTLLYGGDITEIGAPVAALLVMILPGLLLLSCLLTPRTRRSIWRPASTPNA
jgi:hypothetical protein